MSQQLEVIALISGGKDSLYTILHCLKHGHKVVALANLYPPQQRLQGLRGSDEKHAGTENENENENEEDDLDSYMYQTIGHEVIPLYEQALDIPLYREEIRGTAVDVSRDYHCEKLGADDGDDDDDSAATGKRQGEDEIESIYTLLERVMKNHPGANAVCAGAVLSTYQRTRIENVAARLGLVPLAWLWMYPYLPAPVERGGESATWATGLLEDMAACGCEARIIKVASGGLGEDVLWSDVAGSKGANGTVVRRSLVKKLGRFLDEGVEGAVLGEGGEYESLALDGPGVLWKRKIVVDSVEARVGQGGVADLRIRGAKCVDKVDGEEGLGMGLEDVRVPQMFDDGFKKILVDMGMDGECKGREVGAGAGVAALSLVGREGWSDAAIRSSTFGSLWNVSNITAAEEGAGASGQMDGIKKKLGSILRSQSRTDGSTLSTDDAIFVTVILRSMADFASINVIYSTLFEKPNPPARVTVACGDSLPVGVDIMVSFVFDLGSKEFRRGLHVQSRSYWAPANIGPYSQAISVSSQEASSTGQPGGLVYIAGQIPLNPVSMQHAFPSNGTETWFKTFVSQTTLSLQHLWRIGTEMKVDWWLGSVAYISGKENVPAKAAVAWEIWKKANAEHATDEDKDEEDSLLDAWDIQYGRQYDERCIQPRVQQLPNFDVVKKEQPFTPAFFAVQVDELPRNSEVEWQGFGTRTESITMAEEKKDHLVINHTEGPGFGFYTSVEILAKPDVDVAASIQKAIDVVTQKWPEGTTVTHSVIYTPYTVFLEKWQGQVVPCKSVYGHGAEELAAGIVFHNSRAP